MRPAGGPDMLMPGTGASGPRRHRRGPGIAKAGVTHPAATRPADLALDEQGKAAGWVRLRYHAKVLGVAWLGLVAIDVFTGGGAWAHWPGIAMATLLGSRGGTAAHARLVHGQLCAVGHHHRRRSP